MSRCFFQNFKWPSFFSQHVLICSAVETTSSIFLLTTLPQSWHLLTLATADPFPSRASVPHGKGPKKGLQESITRNEPPGPAPPIHHQDLLQPCPETRCSGEHVRCHAMYRPQTTKKEGNIGENSEANILDSLELTCSLKNGAVGRLFLFGKVNTGGMKTLSFWESLFSSIFRGYGYGGPQ